MAYPSVDMLQNMLAAEVFGHCVDKKKASGRADKAEKSGNSFTKVKIDANTDRALKCYFELYEKEVESWFSVIAPPGGTLNQLRADLVKLAGKDWERIRHP